MSYILNTEGFLIPKKDISEKLLKLINNDLIISPKINPQYDKKITFKIYRENSKYYYTPKFWGLNKVCNKPKIRYTDVSKVDFQFNKTLRDHQKEITEKTINQMMVKENGRVKKIGGAIICARTGIGKTIMALYIANKLGFKTVIFTHTGNLANQWIDNIKDNYGSNINIGLIGGNKFNYNKFNPNDYDIIVAMIQTVMKEKLDYSEYFEDFGLSIYDETHHISSKEFNRVAQITNTRYTLGLTATLERSDKTDYLIPWFLGDISYKQEGLKGYAININIYRFNKEKDTRFREIKYNKNVCLPKMINNLIKIEERNNLIYNTAAKFLRENEHQVMVLISERLEHLFLLRKMFGDEFKVGYVIGESAIKKNSDIISEEEIKDLESKRIIFTIKGLVEGFDIKTIQSVFLTTPMSKILQACGRMLRMKPEEYVTNPTIFEIVDEFSLFPNMHITRFKQYKSNYLTEEGSSVSYYNCNTNNNYNIELRKKVLIEKEEEYNDCADFNFF